MSSARSVASRLTLDGAVVFQPTAESRIFLTLPRRLKEGRKNFASLSYAPRYVTGGHATYASSSRRAGRSAYATH